MSIVLRQQFVEGLGVLAGGTLLRCFRAFVHIAAVGAVPLDRGLSLEYLAIGHIADELPVPRFVELLNFGNLFERGCNLREAFITGDFGETSIDGSPFQVLPVGGGFQVRLRVLDHASRIASHYLRVPALKVLEEDLGVLFLILSRLREYVGNLLQTLFPGGARKVGIAVPRLRFPGESRKKVLFCLTALN